jgi:hypothetical protein
MKVKYVTLLASVGCAALLFTASTANAQPALGWADTFAVLGGSAVTLTNAIVTGDVGSPVAVTNTTSTVIGTVFPAGDPVAVAAYGDFLSAYTALGNAPCGTLLTGDLTGLFLTPGVYCVTAASTTTGGTLTLVGNPTDTWIFKIGIGGTGALTGTNFTVVGQTSNGDTWTCDNNVFWWTAEAATLTDSTVIGSILAGTSITLTRGSFHGQALATFAVTVTGTDVSICGNPTPPPPPPPQYPAIKVTGGGQIPVPDPASAGQATFGFNAQPDKKGGAKGNFNYVNHVTGLHVDGPVNSIQVIAVYPDGSAKTVLFSGTCGDTCSYTVIVEDHGEPGTSDEFGVTIIGSVSEVRSQRVISKGNIQFHK